MKSYIKYIYYREIQGSSNKSFNTIEEVHKYCKRNHIENYEVKQVFKV
jgi:hypothetical protein